MIVNQTTAVGLMSFHSLSHFYLLNYTSWPLFSSARSPYLSAPTSPHSHHLPYFTELICIEMAFHFLQ